MELSVEKQPVLYGAVKKSGNFHVENDADGFPVWCGAYILYGDYPSTKELKAAQKVLSALAEMGYEDDFVRVEMIHRPIGAAGQLDPLDLYGSFGWKIHFKTDTWEKKNFPAYRKANQFESTPNRV